MKYLVIALFAFLSISASAQNISSKQESSDTLSQEQKEMVITLTEQILLRAVDSVMQEGMYMRALEVLDSLQTNWKKWTGKDPSPQMYLKKVLIYLNLEEWQQIVDVSKECINNSQEVMPKLMTALMYSMQGAGYRNLEDYKNAIRSYEFAVSYYSQVGNLGNQGDMLCSIAYSYDKLGKHAAASSFYEKGLLKFLQCFNTTKKQLLQRNLKVDDSEKEALMRVFAAHLFNMAIYEQDYGDRLASKDFLLMSAHCGNNTARSEYQRIYGQY